MIKVSVSMTPELHSALTRSALDHHTNLSREIETYLRENPTVQKYIIEVRSEPDTGVFAVSRTKSKVTEQQQGISASA